MADKQELILGNFGKNAKGGKIMWTHLSTHGTAELTSFKT
jgi:hypothetical protein